MRQLLFTLLFAFLTINANSQDPFCETIVTQGKSSVKQTPEIIAFFIEFRLENPNYKDCADLALRKIESVKAKFQENGIDEDLIKTSNYSVSEKIERDNRSGENIHLGYQARIPMSVKTKIDDPAAEKIFEIIKSSFRSDLRINFELSQPQINEVKEKLLELAVTDATSKAEILADNLNIKLARVIKIQYGDPQMIRNFTRSNYELVSRADLMGAVNRASINTLTPSEIEMRTSVMLAWEIEYK